MLPKPSAWGHSKTRASLTPGSASHELERFPKRREERQAEVGVAPVDLEAFLEFGAGRGHGRVELPGLRPRDELAERGHDSLPPRRLAPHDVLLRDVARHAPGERDP